MSSHADTIRRIADQIERWARFDDVAPPGLPEAASIRKAADENQGLREALDRGKRFERCYQESLGAVWTAPMQERLDSLQSAFLDAYVEALAGDTE